MNFNFSFILCSAYLEVIKKGAAESGLPDKYRSFLEKIVHNDCEAHPDIIQKLFPDNEA